MAKDFTTKGLLYPLTKGDVPNHPFHGNQWQKVGNITSERASFITESANKFYKAGGDIQLLSKYSEAIKAYQEQADKAFSSYKASNPTDTSSREYLALLMMTKALGNEYESESKYNGAFVATDANGKLVGVLSAMSDLDKLSVGYLGTANDPDGIGTALEVAVAKYAGGRNLPVRSEALDSSVGYHQAIGRTVGSGDTPSSRWSAKECQAIAKLPIGKEYV